MQKCNFIVLSCTCKNTDRSIKWYDNTFLNFSFKEEIQFVTLYVYCTALPLDDHITPCTLSVCPSRICFYLKNEKFYKSHNKLTLRQFHSVPIYTDLFLYAFVIQHIHTTHIVSFNRISKKMSQIIFQWRA